MRKALAAPLLLLALQLGGCGGPVSAVAQRDPVKAQYARAEADRTARISAIAASLDEPPAAVTDAELVEELRGLRQDVKDLRREVCESRQDAAKARGGLGAPCP